MIRAIEVAIGGAAGCTARFYLVSYFMVKFGRLYPYGILCVNVLGSFLIGICAAFIYQHLKPASGEFATALLITGFLGGFTTFSSFSLDTYTMLSDGRIALATVNILANLVLCITATAIAFYLVTKIS